MNFAIETEEIVLFIRLFAGVIDYRATTINTHCCGK